MARRSRRSFKRFRRAKREYIWATVFGSSILDTVDGVAEGAVLVSKADWARDPSASGHLEKGCVVLRTILDFSMGYPPVGDNLATLGEASAQCFAALRTLDEDDAHGFDFSGDGLDESLMQFGSCAIQSTGSSVATLTWRDRTHAVWRQHWDVRQKRKLTSEELLRIEFAALGPVASQAGLSVLETESGIYWDFSARVLLQLP